MTNIRYQSKRLHDYAFFIAEVNDNLDKGFKLNEAIQTAMKYCIDKGILKDILEKHQSEVFDMLLTEYDEKFYLKLEREEAREEGINCLNTLYQYLLRDGRLEDMEKAMRDSEYRKKLFEEYKI